MPVVSSTVSPQYSSPTKSGWTKARKREGEMKIKNVGTGGTRNDWRRSATRGTKSEIRNQKSEIRNQKSEIRGQRSVVSGQWSGGAARPSCLCVFVVKISGIEEQEHETTGVVPLHSGAPNSSSVYISGISG